MSGSNKRNGTVEHGWNLDSNTTKRIRLTNSQQRVPDSQIYAFNSHAVSNDRSSQPGPDKQPAKIKLSFKLGSLKRQEQVQEQKRRSSATPAVASQGYSRKHNSRAFPENGGDGYYSSYSDDEPVDIDDEYDQGNADVDAEGHGDVDMSEDRDRQQQHNKISLVSEPAASYNVSGNHTPRIKLRFSLKQGSQSLAKESKHSVMQPSTLVSTPLQADTTAASSCAGWGSDYGSVAPGSPSGSVASNASLSTYRRRVSVAESASRGVRGGTYSPSLASEAESDGSESEACHHHHHHHTFEHMPLTPASASASASASATPAPPGTVKRRGRPPLRGRRSSSISSWQARGNPMAATRKPFSASQGINTTVSLKSSLSRLIKRIRKRDSYGFFLEPVDTKVITDYLTVIKQPMDLGTIQIKVESNSYMSIGDFRRDILLVCENARKYNGDGSIYARSADRVQEYATVAIDRETVKLERVGMASISNRAGGNSEADYAYRSRSRSNSRSRSRSRSATPSQYNSAAEDHSDSIAGRDHRRSTRLRWRGAGSGGVSDAQGAAGNFNATPASIVDVFKWSGNAKKKAKRGSNVPKRITESQTKVYILPDGSIDPTGFEEEVALIPHDRNHTSVPLLVRGTRSSGSGYAGGSSMGKSIQGQINAYGQSFAPMSFVDTGPYSKIPGQSLASVSASLNELGIEMQPIHGDSLGMAYWASVSDFIDGAGEEVMEYATTVMDHLTNDSYRVARDTLDAIADHRSVSERSAAAAPVKSEHTNRVDIPMLVHWLDNRDARDRLFAERTDALTKKMLLSELLVDQDVSMDGADAANPPDYISDARRDELFNDTTKKLKLLCELEQDTSALADKPNRDSVCKQIQSNISQLSQQMCMSLAGSHLPNTPVPGLSLPTKHNAAPAGYIVPKYPFTAASAGFPLSGKADVLSGKGSAMLRPSRAVSSPSLPSLHSGLPLRQTSRPL
ncbi:hypothetical protein FB645_001212 [Coemansia sp. IMI 203386]|nr:hypothetical protein FB645_001212 [Coemansia sp. IMI 203386]